MEGVDETGAEPLEPRKETGENGYLKDEKGRFVGGTAPGPGRPTGSVSIVGKLKKMFEENPEDFDAYVKEIRNDPAMRRAVMEQIDGKPKQQLEVSADIINRNVEITDEQFDRIVRARAEELGSQASS